VRRCFRRSGASAVAFPGVSLEDRLRNTSCPGSPPIPAPCRSASMAAACALPWPPESTGELAASASFVPTRVSSAVLIFAAATLSGGQPAHGAAPTQRERPQRPKDPYSDRSPNPCA
jgi:hypothetical protein